MVKHLACTSLEYYQERSGNKWSWGIHERRRLAEPSLESILSSTHLNGNAGSNMKLQTNGQVSQKSHVYDQRSFEVFLPTALRGQWLPPATQQSKSETTSRSHLLSHINPSFGILTPFLLRNKSRQYFLFKQTGKTSVCRQTLEYKSKFHRPKCSW